MTKKWGIIYTICLVICLGILLIPQKPKLISSITTKETAYLTILVDKREVLNVNKLRQKLIRMCIEDSFEEIKLQTEENPLEKRLYISVYTSRKDMEKGNLYMTITYEEGESSPSFVVPVFYSSKSQIPSPSKSI